LNYLVEKPSEKQEITINEEELGSLCRYWNVQLNIRFHNTEGKVTPPYTNYQIRDGKLLHIILCHSKGNLWQIIDEKDLLETRKIKIIEMINDIRNMELKENLLEAINNENVYKESPESYLFGIISVLEDIPMVLQKQKIELHPMDLRLINELLKELNDKGIIIDEIYALKEALNTS